MEYWSQMSGKFSSRIDTKVGSKFTGTKVDLVLHRLQCLWMLQEKDSIRKGNLEVTFIEVF